MVGAAISSRRLTPPQVARQGAATDRPSRISRWFCQMVRRPEGLDGRLATIGLRQPAHSLPTIPTRFANSAAGRSGEDGAVTVALRMNDDQREGLAGGACLTVLDDGRGDGRKKR
jgi:hypothetical protein